MSPVDRCRMPTVVRSLAGVRLCVGMTLRIPSVTRISIVDRRGAPLRVDGVVLGLTCRATERNDFVLGPFFSDCDGRFELDRDRIEIAVAAQIASDCMGHAPIATCEPRVRARLWTGEETARAAEARKLWGLVGREA